MRFYCYVKWLEFFMRLHLANAYDQKHVSVLEQVGT